MTWVQLHTFPERKKRSLRRNTTQPLAHRIVSQLVKTPKRDEVGAVAQTRESPSAKGPCKKRRPRSYKDTTRPTWKTLSGFQVTE